ncbi:botulinum neurotoxin N-terminal receptor binding domain-containing protein [Curtobacterium sp. Leaf261]|uniref:botulinum neurotoxin N-terminal receptor binding domain-containing protein n=1 Tax=Curtobacterium sp. Leaf261 TaxID=1736311 RepID=UPI0006F533EF|nr:hypothetical protein [Curtobacterium sp. Leaf261]KQO59756.1 hypothetical protein ASF23_15830 [Curtobacterium sp. Leaf261]
MSSATDEVAAYAIAKQYGHPVTVESETTPTALVSVQPDGSTKLQEDTVPVRVQDGNDWIPVDTTLDPASASWLEPAATVVPVRFSRGGSDVLAQVQTDTGKWISEAWPDGGNLPAPSVDGSTATYPDVLPDVDLQLNATATGMSEVLVVKTAGAAANPDVEAVELKLSGATVTESDTTSTARASDGSTVTSSKPTWWDSSDNGSADGPGGVAAPTPLPHSSTASTVTLDVAKVADGDVQYPLYVDPDWSAGQQNFWFTDRAYPNQSYLNGSPAGFQSVGYAQQDGTTYMSRAFWEFGTGSLVGKHIVSAQFSATATYSCSPVAVEAWRYGPANPGFTWNTDPNQWTYRLDTQNFASTGGCVISATAVGWDVTRGLVDIAGSGGNRFQIGLRSGDENNISRKHFNNGASLIVTYNSRPNTPTAPVMTSPQRGCSTSASAPTYVNNRAQALTLQVHATDPDAQNVQTQFSVAAVDGSGHISSTSTSWNSERGAQGDQSTQIPIRTFNSDTASEYAWEAITTDGGDYGGWSSWCYFVVKNVGPQLPAVTTVSTSWTVGKPTSVTVGYAAADAIRSIAYWWVPTTQSPDAPSPTPPVTITPATNGDCAFRVGNVTTVCASGTTSTTISAAPIDTVATLWVATYDKAGNVSLNTAGRSSSSGLKFTGVADDAGVSFDTGHGWLLDSGTSNPTSISDSNTASGSTITSGTPLSVGSNTSASPPAGTFNGPTGNALTFPGLTSINRYSGSTHSAAINGGAAAGFNYETNLGDLASVGGPQPTNTQLLYSCALSSGDMTSFHSTCESSGVTGTPLGYIWNTASDVPAPLTPIAVYRCTTGNNDHFDSHSSTCENQHVEFRLGYFAKQTTVNTTHQVIDTSKSFAISAWVRPTEIDKRHNAYTFLSINSPTTSAFWVKIDNGQFQFCMQSQQPHAANCAVSAPISLSSSPDANWRFITAEYDASNQQMRLLLDGSTTVAADSQIAPYAAPANETSATGNLWVGSALSNNAMGDLFAGDVLDPTVVQGIPSSNQLINVRKGGSFSGGGF